MAASRAGASGCGPSTTGTEVELVAMSDQDTTVRGDRRSGRDQAQLAQARGRDDVDRIAVREAGVAQATAALGRRGLAERVVEAVQGEVLQRIGADEGAD